MRARVGRLSVCLVDGTAAVVMTRNDTSTQQSDTHTDTDTDTHTHTHRVGRGDTVSRQTHTV